MRPKKRPTTRLGTLILLAAAGMAASACGDSTDLTSLDDAVVLDAAMLAADATIEEVYLWALPWGLVGAPSGHGSSGFDGEGVAPGHGGPDGPAFLKDRITRTRSVTFFDAEGTEQDAYDPVATASVELLLEMEGSIERGAFVAEVARSREMTVSGLEGEESERTWNGSGTSSMLRSGVLQDGTDRSHSMEGTFIFEDVVVPIPGNEPPYPLSGTIRRSMVMTRTTPDGTETREVEIVITFDGTETATAVVNGEVMEIDLTDRQRRHPFRPRDG